MFEALESVPLISRLWRFALLLYFVTPLVENASMVHKLPCSVRSIMLFTMRCGGYINLGIAYPRHRQVLTEVMASFKKP